MLILAIESSCDETAAAVVADGRRVLSIQIASQVELHARYGGVVPEIASRAHLEAIVPIVEAALSEANVSLDQLDAVAVTRGPGLIGCLLVGVEFAKSIAATQRIPLIAVQHVAGHLYSPFIGRETDAWGVSVDQPADFHPYIGLAISGGHSSIVLVEEPLRHVTLGETLDDAVGEAYDKIAKLIGLGYPGGPIVDRIASRGNPQAFKFPRPLLNRRDSHDFSFSGLKTAFAREVEKLGGREVIEASEQLTADLCASFQAAAVHVLVEKARRALKAHHPMFHLAITGGVACNRGLRAFLQTFPRKYKIAFPDPEYCTDNAAMIAGAAFHIHQANVSAPLTLNASSRLDITAAPSVWNQ